MVKVIDEQGEPAADANAGMGFMTPKDRGEGWGANFSGITDLITDSDGYFTGEGETQLLKKIINPIAMYAVNRGAPRKGELPVIVVFNSE